MFVNTINLSESIHIDPIFLLDMGVVIGALGVVLVRKIIYSALLLGFVFICVALLYLLLNADFLAAAQVLIYVGAVNVLIVFAVMLVSKPDTDKIAKWTLADGMSASLCIGLFLFLIKTILNPNWQQANLISTSNDTLEKSIPQSINIIGIHFLTDLLLPFELLSILLLVALIGAITIARKDNSTEINN
uniref:NAD(P)H-quinone oxidoreductase subunit 6, chloroplastic n=1 Tax=Netrium digitus TaxID=43946 RepID=A0A191T506_9VIRI|nr:subunit 6 of NADH-plastoquinone oxidoreductase [Netrium digitus]ANI25483.1 subunit 6 of NADH-plastoquinone oxidoreductase [Netrium digitus]